MLVYLLSAILSLSVHADTQRVVDYEYDAAGNIIGVRSGRNLGPPDVTALNPAFVNKESSNVIVASGLNLYKAAVATAVPGLSITNVTSTETTVTFKITASDTAEIGNAALTFTTRLGSDTEDIIVADRTPVISTDPNPIILQPDGQPISVTLLFDEPYATDQIYDVAITNTAVAAISVQTLTLSAGEREVSLDIRGLTVGTTNLEINQLSNFLALNIPVIVTADTLPPGSYQFKSRLLSVVVNQQGAYPSNSIFKTSPIGVVVNYQGNYPSNSVFATPPLGVVVNFQGSYPSNSLFNAPLVGVVNGAAVTQISPETVIRNSAVNLVMQGYNLDAVTAVTFIPVTGITQTGPLSVTPDGEELTLPISIAVEAPTNARVIRLTTSQGSIDVPMPLIVQ